MKMMHMNGRFKAFTNWANFFIKNNHKQFMCCKKIVWKINLIKKLNLFLMKNKQKLKIFNNYKY